MLGYTSQEVGWAMGCEPRGMRGGSVNSVCTDSRQNPQGHHVLFVALPGPQRDGHAYVEPLYRNNGVRHFVVAHMLPEFRALTQACFFVVEDTLGGLQRFASYHRHRFKIPVVGITGSNGKTVVKEWLAQLIASRMREHHSPKSYNSQLGVPLSLLGLMPQHEVGIYEAGISRRGEMESLAGMIEPTIGIFTHLGSAHQEGFESRAEKLREKFGLFGSCETLVVSREEGEAYSYARQESVRQGKRLLDWSLSEEDACLRIALGEAGPEGHPFVAHWKGGGSEEEAEGLLPFQESVQIANACHALAGGLALGMPLRELVAGIAELRALPMRMEVRDGIYDTLLLNDSYSLDLDSLESAICVLQLQTQARPRAAVVSDIVDSGMEESELYGALRKRLEGRFAKVITVGPQCAKWLSDMPEAENFLTTEELLSGFDFSQLAGYGVMVKGARRYGFERICHRMSARHHRTRMEISLSSLAHNLRVYRGRLAEGVKLLVLVKAAAYGNGLVELGRFLASRGVDYLGVAIADEGVALRRAGVEVPILVLNPGVDNYETLLEHRLESEIFSLENLREVSQMAEGMRLVASVHLKLDTGMHRTGFGEEALEELLAYLSGGTPHVRIAGLMTHLAAADDPSEDGFTRAQLARFTSMCDRIESVLGEGDRPLRHALNSAGILRFPEGMNGMVRLGIGLHGYSPVEGVGLRPAARLLSYIAQIRDVAPGEGVGYGHKNIQERAVRVGVVPIGYADGYARHLGNGRACMGIHGVLVPTLGNVCMDVTLVDLTSLPEARVGDEVTLFGANPSLVQLCEWWGTIPYEPMSVLSPRIPRVYYEE